MKHSSNITGSDPRWGTTRVSSEDSTGAGISASTWNFTGASDSRTDYNQQVDPGEVAVIMECSEELRVISSFSSVRIFPSRFSDSWPLAGLVTMEDL